MIPALGGPNTPTQHATSAPSTIFSKVFLSLLAIAGYRALAGGTIPFIRRYSTICP